MAYTQQLHANEWTGVIHILVAQKCNINEWKIQRIIKVRRLNQKASIRLNCRAENEVRFVGYIFTLVKT